MEPGSLSENRSEGVPSRAGPATESPLGETDEFPRKRAQSMMPRAKQALILCCSFVPLLLGGPAAARTAARRGKVWSNAHLKQVLIDFGQDNIGVPTLRTLGQPSTLARVAALQRTARTDDALHYFTAFTMAYFGRSYGRNVRVLTYPVELWSQDNRRYQERYVAHDPVSFDPADGVPDLLVRLYDHNHDRKLLGLLISWGFDGAYAENIMDLQRGLMGEYSLDVLDVLRHSTVMTGGALEALLPIAPGDPELPESKGVIRDIRQALVRAKPPVRRYGRWFLREYARRLRANGSAPNGRRR
jgi:hypothetical protein